MSGKQEHWRKIIAIHQYTKQIILRSEEFGDEHRTFLQPAMELRNALDHIVRVAAVEYGTNGRSESERYIEIQLDRAIGHLYRAFFDAADFFSVIIRDRVLKALSAYSPDAIQAAIPQYYSSIRPEIDRISLEIARLRDEKDIGEVHSEQADQERLEATPDEQLDNWSVQIEEYHNALKTLLADYETVVSATPSLIEYSRKSKREGAKRSLWQVLLALLSAIFGGLVTYFLTK